VNINFLSFVTKLSTFAILTDKQCGQLLKEILISSKDITSSLAYLKGWRIFKMTAVSLETFTLYKFLDVDDKCE